MNTQIVEINQASVAGKQVLDQIDLIQNKLSRAKTWGFIDLFSDSGLLTTILKHNKLHEAQDSVEVLKEKIKCFNSELQDIKVNEQINSVMMSKGIIIADWLIDGLVIDVVTLSRISDSQSEINKLKSEVEGVLKKLDTIKQNL